MKKNYINDLFIAILFLCSSSIFSQNVITDGDFSTTTEIVNLFSDPQPMNTWSYYAAEGDGVNITPTVENGVCKFEISSLGLLENFWDIQLLQQGFQLNLGHAYEISFDVKADAYRWFRVFLGEVEGNWTSFIGHDQWHEAHENWNTITIPFEAWAVFPLHKLSFELGDDSTTIYFDNISVTDLGLAEHSIGIIGDAVNGWNDEDEVEMYTTDWVNYTLTNQPLNPGAIRFRQDGNWDVNWGGETFPNGHVIFYGPDLIIPHPAIFDISFNRLTGEYNFDCVADCPLEISMVGSALNGWENDINMYTQDGVTYMLSDYFFTSGDAKFRQDGDWAINWGSDTFPTGVAIQDGPNIPVTEGFYNVTFNWQTGEYSFDMPSIGILGSSLPGEWWEDVDLQSDDGIYYTINELYLSEGEVKFRLNNSWIVNWGSESFPSGIGYQNGPNIPILEGTYDITFNKITGEYSFMATTCPFPELICPEDIYENSSFGMCGTYVYYPEVIPTPNCGGDGITITQTSGLPSGNMFPVGMTTNTFQITSETGEVAYCSFNVYVTDSEAPVIMNLNEYYEPLWPPNHQMVEIFIDYTVVDNCPTTTEIMISSNEPENGLGDGDLYPDWQIIDEHNVLLRAERSGNGSGREYYITIIVYDDSMNYTEQQVTVTVPHDRRGNLQDSRVLLYPNAAKKVINIKGLELSKSISYQIYDMFGIVKGNGLLINNKIDIESLPDGMYFIRFETENGNYFKKFLKK